MENRTKFDLKENIEIWKSELSQNSNMTLDNINELESHLQDEIHDLQQLGLSAEESLLIAKNRIGNIEELTSEFGKVNKTVYFRNRIIPYLKGILLFIGFITITELLITISLLTADKIGMNNENLNLVTIGLLIISTSAIFVFFYKKYKNRNFKIQSIINIPILVSTILISKLISFIITWVLIRELTTHNLRFLSLSFSISKILIGIFIITVSCIVYYSSKRENKMKIVE